MQIGGWSQEEKITPFVIANVKALVGIHSGTVGEQNFEILG